MSIYEKIAKKRAYLTYYMQEYKKCFLQFVELKSVSNDIKLIIIIYFGNGGTFFSDPAQCIFMFQQQFMAKYLSALMIYKTPECI